MTPRRRGLNRFVLASCLAATSQGCERERDREDPGRARPAARKEADEVPAARPPAVLYLPDGGDTVVSSETPGSQLLLPRGSTRCPPEMVDVRGRFCIDRYENVLVDAASGKRLSPYYHPSSRGAVATYDRFREQQRAATRELDRLLAVPEPPRFQRDAARLEPKAVSLPGEIPQGYMSGESARAACERAGKRLCRTEEWMLACRGEHDHDFPYGPSYRPGACNVGREAHPAYLLHGDASQHHLDPRLNLVRSSAGPLLRRTGQTPECVSPFGEDGVFDMVGNLDEWVDDPEGRFVGGFYARGTTEGCNASIESHPPDYYDYSLGVRCCSP